MFFVKQGLHADSVPGQKKPLRLSFPHPKGENAVEPMDTFRSPLGIGMEHHLRVGMPRKPMSQLQQSAADFPGVVQLPVVDQHIALPCPAQLHRLPATLRIDNGQSGVEQAAIPVFIASGIIRAAPCHGCQHFFLSGLLRRQGNHSGNRTHKASLPFHPCILCRLFSDWNA